MKMIKTYILVILMMLTSVAFAYMKIVWWEGILIFLVAYALANWEVKG